MQMFNFVLGQAMNIHIILIIKYISEIVSLYWLPGFSMFSVFKLETSN